jgi:hypothetical protein
MKKYIFKLLIISTLCIIILSFNSTKVFSQIFSAEQNPPSIKWSQINSSNFQIIYPTQLEDEAQRMANTLEHIIGGVSKSLNIKPRKISIILQNQSVISNGFVQLAPRRSEFFTTPPQNIDFQDWLNSLAVHELRHVVQFDKLIPNLKAPFFEELALAIFGISLPPWFYEGDAVGIETALSHAGRGRVPEWELFFKTNSLGSKSYSYSKNYFGSFKDRTPGYYQLGYFMTSKLRRDFGEGIMDSILTRISRNPLRPYNLSNSIKKYTGLNSSKLHDSTLSEIKNLWQKQLDQVQPRTYSKLNKRKDSLPSDYLLPIRISNNQILALKQNVKETPSLILIDDNGNEKTVKKIGYQTEPNFNYAAGKIVWDELRFDKRYFKRSYNVINILDLESGAFKQITHKSRLFSPALSADGKKVVAIMIREDNKNLLVELKSETGELIKEYLPKVGQGLQMPSYNKTGDRVICTASSKDGSSLLEFSLLDGSQKLLLPFARQQISRAIYAANTIIFRAHYNGINNIYSLEPGTNRIKTISNVKFGASNPSFHSESNTIIFNNYQESGYDISSVPFEIETEISAFHKDTFIDFSAPLVLQESNTALLDSIPKTEFLSRPYKESKNLFYFHSLSPIMEDGNDNNELKIGLKLKSNNKLNTFDFYTGYLFNSGLKRNEYLVGISYKRFYPIFNLKYVNRAQVVNFRQKNSIIPINWRESFIEMEMNIPFTFNRLNKTFNMGIFSSSSFTSRYDIQNKPVNFIEKLRFPLKHTAYFRRNTQKSLRDLAPKWGQNFTATYFHLPFETQLNGSLFAFKSMFYSPGVLKNHSFQASFNYQKSDGAYSFNIEIPRVSGYNNLNPISKLRNTLLLDYRFPLFYPDAEIGPIAYVKRVKGGLFTDFENIGKGSKFQARSYGIELSSDMNLMRFFLPEFELAGKLIFSNELSRNKPIFEIGLTYKIE